MIAGQPHFIKNIIKAILTGLFVSSIASCVVLPKNYPRNKPFVYDYSVDVKGNLGKDAKNDLQNKLENQLDDSIKVRRVTRLFYKGLLSSVVNNPPVYDPANADKSVIFMRALLNSLGYFTDSISYRTDTVFKNPDKYLTTVKFTVLPGKQVLLDSIRYNLPDSQLQSITNLHKKEAFIKKGDPFAKGTISAELDRLVDLYRNNGYLRFTKDELKGYWDTLNLALLNPSLDPFEQITLLDSIRKTQVNPKANIEIRLRPGFDSSKLIKYYIGNISVYPDFNTDTAFYSRKETTLNGVRVVYYRRLFKPKILPPNIYFHHGELYNQSNYFKTVNRFTSLGSWNLINIDTTRRKNQDTVDFHIRLSPAKKYSFTTTLEGSRNQSAISGNLFGIAINFGLQNRNFAKAADQANTNARYGIELGKNKGQNFIQTQQRKKRPLFPFATQILSFQGYSRNRNWIHSL
jgi:outer membrane protein insertion porin family